MNRFICTFFIFASFFGLSAYSSAQSSAQQTAESMADDPVFSQGIFSAYALTGDGKRTVDVNGSKMLVPASNMKLITTGTALHTLGTGFRFETRIGHSGHIEDGILYGDLYITGGADPTLGSKDSIAVDLDKVFTKWEKFIREAGIRHIEGRIIGDGRWLDGMEEEETWLWNDIGTYYGTGVTGLMFYENMQSFIVSAGQKPGDPIEISPYYPECPWMEFSYDCSTGRSGSGDRLYMYTGNLAPKAMIRGTFGVDRAKKRVDFSNKFPEYTCAVYFERHLRRKGITCKEGASDLKLCKDADPCKAEDIKVLGSTFSPELKRIVFETNHASNNVFAETLLRTLGKACRNSSCYDSSYVAVDAVLKQLGMDISEGIRIQDGSGLSRQNLISPEFMCGFLKAMMDSPCYQEFLGSLPVPGGNGTLSYNMKNYPQHTRSRIRVKSGSMNGVRCYSGYILPEGHETLDKDTIRSRTIIFSIMTNNCTSPNWKVRPMLDRMMASLAETR